MHDIAIVGGGPGGLYAAYRLAQSGLDVAVFEEHSVAGNPVHCTGVLAAEAFEDFGIPSSSILNPLKTAQLFGPSGGSIEYSTPRLEALVIDRAAFDLTLFEMAESAGAVVRVGARVTELSIESDRIALTVGGQKVEARAGVLACGANYTLQRRLGLGMPALHLQSVQLEVPASNPGHVEVHFGADVAPKGFAWVVPVYRDERPFARIGLMCDRDAREYFEKFLSRVGPRWQTGTQGCFDGGRPSRGKMLPLAPIERTFTNRLLAVGDAAGIVKATTGGGIYYSLASAVIAADVLAASCRSGDFSETALAVYESRWQSLLGDELSAQRDLRDIADRLSDEDIEGLFELARTDDVMPIVRRTAQFNRHRHLIMSLLSHPPARRVLMRRVLGWGQTA
jgi:geranylgeranyl reductase family protein